MLSKVWDAITYPFLGFNGATVELKFGMGNQFHPIYSSGYNYLSMLGLKLKPYVKLSRYDKYVNFLQNLNRYPATCI